MLSFQKRLSMEGRSLSKNERKKCKTCYYFNHCREAGGKTMKMACNRYERKNKKQ